MVSAFLCKLLHSLCWEAIAIGSGRSFMVGLGVCAPRKGGDFTLACSSASFSKPRIQERSRPRHCHLPVAAGNLLSNPSCVLRPQKEERPLSSLRQALRESLQVKDARQYPHGCSALHVRRVRQGLHATDHPQRTSNHPRRLPVLVSHLQPPLQALVRKAYSHPAEGVSTEAKNPSSDNQRLVL